MRSRELLLALVTLSGLLLPPPGLLAQDPPPWTLHTIRGEQLSGDLRLGADGQLHFREEDGERSLALDEVHRLEHRVVVGQARDARRRVWLRSGVEVPVSSVSGVGRELTAGVFFAGEPLTMSLHFIAAMRVSEESVETDFEEQLAEPGDSADYLYILNEGRTTRMSVAVLGFDADTLNIEFSSQQIQVPWESVYGVIFGRDSGAMPDRQPKPRVRLALRQGAELEGRLVSLDETAELRLDEGSSLRIAKSEIVTIYFATDKLVYLTDLKPVSEEQTPALDRVWPWIADRSPSGEPIQLGGREYDKGLVLFPRTRLTYDLDGSYEVFETVIGIEDRGGPQANAVFRVIADDKVLFESAPLLLGGEPKALRISVQNVKHLTLEADFGENLDIGDHCVFADARVIQG